MRCGRLYGTGLETAPERVAGAGDEVFKYLIELCDTQRQMPFVREQVCRRGRYVARQPLAVRERHHPVIAALPDGHGARDRRQVEAQISSESKVVVAPPADAGGYGPVEGFGRPFGVVAGQRRLVDLSDQ